MAITQDKDHIYKYKSGKSYRIHYFPTKALYMEIRNDEQLKYFIDYDYGFSTNIHCIKYNEPLSSVDEVFNFDILRIIAKLAELNIPKRPFNVFLKRALELNQYLNMRNKNA